MWNGSSVRIRPLYTVRRFDPQLRLLAALALAAGGATAWHYHRLQLTLSHYDAKAHLVVARRILDSLTPGWDQIGAVWLPLPHLLQALPVQVDWFYRTGAFGVALSVVCYAVTTAAIFSTVRRLTGSSAAALAGAAMFAANPNVLYLQSTPMTEPLLFALTMVQVELLVRWTWRAVGTSKELPSRLVLRVPRDVGWVMVLACLTRYEAWPVTAAAWLASAYTHWRHGTPLRTLAPVYARLALYPIGAALGFVLLSRITVGEWFVTGGFYVPDAELMDQPLVVIGKMIEGTMLLGGSVFTRAAILSVVAIAIIAFWLRDKTALLIPIALVGAAALPFYGYVSGHPFRIRYEVPLILAGSVAVGLAVGQLRRFAPAVALALALLVIGQTRPLDPQATMVKEAQLDRRNAQGRRRVTRCLVDGYRGETIMASMGALAHYMQELSAEGFAIGDFLHEGNHPMWDSAITRGPAPLVGWVLVEERAEGGDALFLRQRELPHFLDGFDRVCEGGNVALYRRR